MSNPDTITETSAPTTSARWHVVGFSDLRRSEHRGGRCEVCGRDIMRVFKLAHDDGRRLVTGPDCAVTIEGGPSLAELRAAERAERGRVQAEYDAWVEAGRRTSMAERLAATAAANLRVFATLLDECDEIAGAPAGTCSAWERKFAGDIAADIRRGGRTFGLVETKSRSGFCEADAFAAALIVARLPPAKHLGHEAGARVTFEAIYLRTAGMMCARNFFRAPDGSVVVWTTSFVPAIAYPATAERIAEVRAEVARVRAFGGTTEWYPGKVSADGSGTIVRNMKIGERAYLTATVAEHGAYEGTPQTHVSRATITAEPPAAKRPARRKRAA